MTIYFIEMEGSAAIKIGFTANIDISRRIAQLQTGQPARIKLIGFIPGDMAVEKSIHAEFAAYRKNGEWFEGPPIFRRFIEYLIANQLPWTFSRAYAMVDDFASELTNEVERLKTLVPSNASYGSDWRDKELGKKHRRIKEQQTKIDALEELVLETRSRPAVGALELVNPQLLSEPIVLA